MKPRHVLEHVVITSVVHPSMRTREVDRDALSTVSMADGVCSAGRKHTQSVTLVS